MVLAVISSLTGLCYNYLASHYQEIFCVCR